MVYELVGCQWLRGLPSWLSWRRIWLQCGRPWFSPWVGKIPWRRERLPTPVFWLENPMDCIVYRVAERELDMTERLSLTRWKIFMEDGKWNYNILKIPPLISNASLRRSFPSNYSFALFISIKKSNLPFTGSVSTTNSTNCSRFSVWLKSVSFVGPWTRSRI